MDVVDQLAWFVPILSIGFVALLTSINVYMRIRRSFAITVNCWFCMRNARVPYEAANSWHCPNCEQYNGFAPDGDYNREIPAQRVAKLNGHQHYAERAANESTARSSAASSLNASTASNGLCTPCNLNQELKVQQLAAFEPQHTGSFNQEIEQYQRQLEQSYRLCSRCERHVRRRLTHVKRTVLGSKLAQIGANGLRAFDMHLNEQRRGGAAMQGRLQRRRVVSLCASILLILAAIAVMRTASEVVLTAASLNRVLPAWMTRGLLVAYASGRAVFVCFHSFGTYVWSAVQQTAVLVITGTNQNTADDPHGEGAAAAATTPGNASLKYVEQLAQRTTEQAAILCTFESERTLCVAALLICLLTVWLHRFRRAALLMLLSWSLRTVLPGLLISAKSAGRDTPEMMVVIDMMRCIVDMLICGTTMWAALAKHDAHSKPGTFIKKRQRQLDASLRNAETSSNSSFHRIYTEADTGDLSDDDIDGETVLSGSYRLMASHRTPPPLPLSTEHYQQSQHNRSLNSTSSMSPSAFTPRTMSHSNGHTNGLFRTSSIRSLNVSRCGEEEIQRHNETIFAPSSSHSKYHSMNGLNSTLYDVPDEFQSGITQLNISGTRLPPNKVSANEQLLKGLPSCGGAAPRYVSLGELTRSTIRPQSIIGPARLRAPSTIHESATATNSISPARSSWLAGGYWNSQVSPQKRGNCSTFISARVDMPIAVSTVDRVNAAAVQFPFISRTSSQSSGFESRDNDSRESSLGPGGVSVVAPSMAVLAASISPNDSVSQCGIGPFAEPPYKPTWPTQSHKDHFGGSTSFVGGNLRNKAISSEVVSSAKGNVNLSINRGPQSTINDIQPGSLLRSWQMRTSQLDVSGRT